MLLKLRKTKKNGMRNESGELQTSCFNFNSHVFLLNRWSAQTVIGQPRVYPQYGDLRGSWASATKDAHQFIEVCEDVPEY
jgi:hypothetical protein